MKAMILAAGLGTRLRPFTDTMPKALAEVGGKPVLELIARKLAAAGVTDIVVNVHHHAGMMRNYLDALHIPGVRFHISDETDLLLDTGGGMLAARRFLEGDEPFFLYNGDILTDADLRAMYSRHKADGALVTLAASIRHTSRCFLWDDGQLAGWEHIESGQVILCRPQDARPEKYTRMAFSGIALVESRIFELITERGVFSTKEVYLRLAAHHTIRCFVHDDKRWAETGSHAGLARARELFGNQAHGNLITW